MTSPPSAQSCDFFEAQLISYLCGHTAFVAPADNYYDFKRSLSQAVPVGARLINNQSQQANEGLTLAVSPWEGTRVTLGGAAFQYSNTSNEHFFPAGVGPTKTFAAVNGSQAGWFDLGAELTLWDRSTASGRYIFNLVANVESTPGGGPYAARNVQAVGLTSDAKWSLGPGYSLNYSSTTLLQYIDKPEALQLTGNSRLLVAADDWGVAIGPRLVTTAELWHAAGVNTGWSSVSLGGEAMLEPFRATRVAVLRDLTFDAYGQRSIGQAGLTPNWNGSTSSYQYGGSARFNFQY